MFAMIILAAASANAADITKLIINRESHTLTAYAGDVAIQSFDVIYGKTSSPTPALTTSFNTIDINPTWNPTQNSQRFMKKHPELIAEHGIEFKSDGTMYSPPGPKNPMGKARLNLQFGPPPIRIHGTSEPELFKTKSRRYSSGCVRVLEIKQLTELILDQPVDWDSVKTIKLNHPVEVIIN